MAPADAGGGSRCAAPLVPTAHRLTKGIPNHNINVDLGYAERLHENEGKGLEVLACSSQTSVQTQARLHSSRKSPDHQPVSLLPVQPKIRKRFKYFISAGRAAFCSAVVVSGFLGRVSPRARKVIYG